VLLETLPLISGYSHDQQCKNCCLCARRCESRCNALSTSITTRNTQRTR
jgi:hypothetical protein